MQSTTSSTTPFDRSRYTWREVVGDEEGDVLAPTTITELVDDWKAYT